MLGAILGAAGSIASSIFGNKAAKKAADQNIKLQKQFAQQGVQWKVNDAKKAGIHPLYALGASTHSFSPVSVGGSTPDLGAMGQNIGNAIDATQTSSTRLDKTMGALAVERATLENELLRTQIGGSRLALSRNNPPFPNNATAIPGQGNVQVTDPTQISTVSGDPSRDAAVNPELTYTQGPMGYSPNPSEQAKAAQEDNMLLEAGWAARHIGGPMIGNREHTSPPPNSWLPFGANTWKFHAPTMQWRPWNSNLKEYVKNSNLPIRR